MVKTTNEELFGVFQQLLAPLNDGHVQMMVPDKKVYYSNIYYNTKLEDELFDMDLIKNNYLQNSFKESEDGGNTYGWIGNVGYLYIKWESDNWLSTSEILDYFSEADGLIIDMRHNRGGDFTYAYSEFGRFTNEERYTHRSKTKNGPGENDFTDWFEWSVSPDGEYYDKPLVLLTDRYTISAGERATMAFKSLPNLVHMGDTTNGSQSTMIPKELHNGWAYTVVPQKIELFDGKSYEGIGLIPDIVIENTVEEMEAGQDKQLEAAINHLK